MVDVALVGGSRNGPVSAVSQVSLGVDVGHVVHEGGTPSLEEVHIRLQGYADTTAGRVVAVEILPSVELGERTFLLLTVTGVAEVNPHETPQGATVREVIPIPVNYAPEGRSTVIYRLATAEPLEEVTVDAEFNVLRTQAPRSIARAGYVVWDAPLPLVFGAFGFEQDPDLALEVGSMPEVDVPVNLSRSVVQRHIFIGGGIGSGKSYTRGVLAEELFRLGVPQVNIDVNGEMVECAVELGGKNLSLEKGEFTLPLSALTGQDVIDAVPAINRGTNIETLVFHAQEQLIRDLVHAKGSDFGVDDLKEAIGRLAPGLKMDARTAGPAAARVESLNRLDYIGAPFPWEQALTPGAFINIDCRRMLVSDLRLVTASVARDLQRLARAERIPFLVLSVDEFHLVAPNGEDAVTKQALREIARLGRHLRIGLLLTTQSPSDVDRAILKRLLTRFLHAIEPDQLDALRGVFSDAPDAMIRALPKMPVGRCVITGAFETVKHAALVDIRQRVTTDGGGSPPIWDELESLGWPGKLPLADLGGQRNDF